MFQPCELRHMESFQRDTTFFKQTGSKIYRGKYNCDLEICEVVESKIMEGDDGWTLGVQRDVQRKIIFHNDFTFDFHISFSDFNLLISIIFFSGKQNTFGFPARATRTGP